MLEEDGLIFRPKYYASSPHTKMLPQFYRDMYVLNVTHTCIPHSIEMVLEVDSPNDIFDTK